MSSTRSISFRKRNQADEIYTFPIKVEKPTFNTQNSVVLIEHQDECEVLIIAGNLPGMNGYYKNHPDVVDQDEEKQEEHRLSRELLDEAKEHLSEYDPQTSSSESHQGNRHMNDLYVFVDEEKRDEVVLKIWKMLNHLKDRHIEHLQNKEDESYQKYPQLDNEILEITKER